MTSRRKALKTLGSIPLVGGLLGTDLIGTARRASAATQFTQQSVFEELGVEPLINARGTMTYLSGTLMRPEVVEAISAASNEFVNMHELQDKVGAEMSKLLGCEAAMVTSGAAGALAVGTAGVLTGKDQEKIDQLPHLSGPPREVIIQESHRFVFDQNVRMAGVRFVEVEGPRQMEQAMNANTVMCLFFNAASSWYGIPDSIPHERFVEIARQYNVPTFIDAAADTPPVDRLFKYQKMGFDLVTFSGGKMIRGPQSTGLLYGRKSLIEAAKLNFNPYEAPIGRSMKVNKEEIVGMYVALKSYLERDHEQEWQEWIERTERIAESVEKVPTVQGETVVPPGPANEFPGLDVSWDQSRVGITPEEVEERLRRGKPRIETLSRGNRLSIAVVTLKLEHVDTVGRRIREVLERAV